MNPCFAIIDCNTLSRSRLKELLNGVFPGVETLTYSTVEGFIRDSNRHFIHFFVSDMVMIRCSDEFEPLKSRTTVLSSASCFHTRAGYHILDITSQEREIITALKGLRETFRNGACYPDYVMDNDSETTGLSPREREVLRLILQGLTSREIASSLGISLPTATFHRNNICTKLGTRSIASLTVQAILLGLIGLDEI